MRPSLRHTAACLQAESGQNPGRRTQSLSFHSVSAALEPAPPTVPGGGLGDPSSQSFPKVPPVKDPAWLPRPALQRPALPTPSPSGPCHQATAPPRQNTVLPWSSCPVSGPMTTQLSDLPSSVLGTARHRPEQRQWPKLTTMSTGVSLGLAFKFCTRTWVRERAPLGRPGPAPPVLPGGVHPLAHAGSSGAGGWLPAGTVYGLGAYALAASSIRRVGTGYAPFCTRVDAKDFTRDHLGHLITSPRVVFLVESDAGVKAHRWGQGAD